MSCASRLSICVCIHLAQTFFLVYFTFYLKSTHFVHAYTHAYVVVNFFSSSTLVFLCFCVLYNYHILAYKKINYNMDVKSFCLSLNSYCEKAVIILLLLLLPLNQNYYYYHYHVHIIM